MRILLYSANYSPELTGIGKYSGEMAAWLAACGHEVRVVAAPPYYPQWKVAESHRRKFYSREVLESVEVWRSPLWVPSKPGGVSRVLHLFTFAVSSLPVMLWQSRWRPDVVMTVAPAFICAPTGWMTARLSRAKAWLHVQDFEVDVALRLGLLKGRWLCAAVGALERGIFRRFDRVSSISEAMLCRARAKGVQASDLVYFPNWVDLGCIKPLEGASGFRRDWGVPDDAVVALYSGSFGGKHGLMLIPEAARRLQHLEQLRFVICGEGVLRAELEAACKDLPNVRLLPLQPAQKLGDLLGAADIHLLPQSQDAEDLVMPSKLAGMLASGRPVVATCRANTAISQVVLGRGIAVLPGDIEAFAQAIAALATAPQMRAEMGMRARQYAEEHLAHELILGRLLGELTALTAPRGSLRVHDRRPGNAGTAHHSAVARGTEREAAALSERAGMSPAADAAVAEFEGKVSAQAR